MSFVFVCWQQNIKKLGNQLFLFDLAEHNVLTEEPQSYWQSARGPVRLTFKNLVVVVTPNTTHAVLACISGVGQVIIVIRNIISITQHMDFQDGPRFKLIWITHYCVHVWPNYYVLLVQINFWPNCHGFWLQIKFWPIIMVCWCSSSFDPIIMVCWCRSIFCPIIMFFVEDQGAGGSSLLVGWSQLERGTTPISCPSSSN